MAHGDGGGGGGCGEGDRGDEGGPLIILHKVGYSFSPIWGPRG